MAQRRRGQRYRDYADAVVYAVAARFLPPDGPPRSPEGDDVKVSADDVAKQVNAEFGVRITREDVYSMIAEARRRGFFLLCPPPEIRLGEQLIERYRIDSELRCSERPVQVVNVRGEDAMIDVAAQAAKVAYHIVLEMAARKQERAQRTKTEPEPVRVGLASGWSTRLVSRHLAALLSQEIVPPKLAIHAISSGFSVKDPATASVSFFNFFQGIPNVEYVGLFANPYVSGRDYDATVAAEPTVATAFEFRDKIDLVISSLASSKDKHGELSKFINAWTGWDGGDAPATEGAGTLMHPRDMEPEKWNAMSDPLRAAIAKRVDAGRALLMQLRNADWVGDVQYRPYSKTGPITADLAVKAVSMFELAELVENAGNPKKAVLLVAGPCGLCGNPRHEALEPLLSQPNLRVWSHLVMDAETAEMCIRAPERG